MQYCRKNIKNVIKNEYSVEKNFIPCYYDCIIFC